MRRREEEVGRKRGGGRNSREGVPAARNHGPTGDSTMQTSRTLHGNANTYLTHVFGRGLADDRYVVERFKSMTNGDIRPLHAGGPGKKGRRQARRVTLSLKAVKEMRPERDEIIICTGVTIKGGTQIWGDLATGLFVQRKQR